MITTSSFVSTRCGTPSDTSLLRFLACYPSNLAALSDTDRSRESDIAGPGSGTSTRSWLGLSLPLQGFCLTFSVTKSEPYLPSLLLIARQLHCTRTHRPSSCIAALVRTAQRRNSRLSLDGKSSASHNRSLLLPHPEQ